MVHSLVLLFKMLNRYKAVISFASNNLKGDFLKLGRQRCDEKFFNMMVQSCRKQEYARRNTCVYWARGYFDAVSSYGENNYDGKASCCNKTVILNEAGKN